jgi:SpoVK/Ycf46/Vps4 family AAA+-type ATPase
MDNLKDLEILINSHYPIISIETFEELRAEEMVDHVSRNMGLPLFRWSATEGLIRSEETKPVYNTKSLMDALKFIQSSSLEAVYLLKDVHHFLKDPLTVRKLRDICQSFHEKRKSLILTAPAFDVPLELKKEIVRFELKLPGRRELKALVKKVFSDIAVKRKIVVPSDSETVDLLINNLKGLTLSESERLLTRAIIEDGRLDGEDLTSILELKKRQIEQSGVLEYFPREESFRHIGGLKNIKRWLKIRQGAFTDEAREFGLDLPRGVLLIGVQGCGKSLVAKAIAQEWGFPLIKLDTGRLFNKFIGETEKNMQEAIRLSESLSPCILWVDEIEKAFAGTRSSEADGGVGARVLGTFLSWLQEKDDPVFVAATSNDISRLPPELLRKGRLDEIFFVDLPGVSARGEIFSIHLKRRKRDLKTFDVDALIYKSEGFSGAEIEQAIVSSLYASFSRKQELTTELIIEELENTYPLSVVMKEKIDELREWARSRTVSAN